MDELNYVLNKYGVSKDEKRVDLDERRVDLAELFRELEYVKGAEIGVEQGSYSKVLLDSNPSLELHCVDAWSAYGGYRDHVTQSKLDGFYETTKERLVGYDAHLHRAYSTDAVRMFRDDSLDFVYIDANHDFLHVTEDIHYWSKKVRKGGIVSGHDFNRYKKKDYKCHVKDVVGAWTYAHGIRPLFVYAGDKSASWMYVKE